MNSDINKSQLDKFEIFQLAYKFADAANRKDGKLFQSLWADNDAKWHIGPPVNKTFSGKESMGESVTRMLGLWEFFVQMVNGGVVELIDENHATARFYVNEVANSKDGHGNYNLSMYEDTLVKIDGTWYFQSRNYKTIFQSGERQKGEIISVPQ